MTINNILKTVACFSFLLISSSCKLIEIAIEELENHYEEEQSNNTNPTNDVTNPTDIATNQIPVTEAEKWKDGPNSTAHGKSGFLWKPISESDGYPVVLIGPRFTNKTPKYILLNGIRWERVGIGNGYREHYRASKNKKHYTGTVIVEVNCTDGLNGTSNYKWKWVVPDATKRWDGNITPTFTKL